MNNFEQTTTYKKVIELIDKLNLTPVERLGLITIINAYSWISSNDILIEATYHDIITLFLEELERKHLQSKEERDKFN